VSRIRTIKPDFWSSAQVMECSPNARLLFIGMWNFADDKGRLPLSPKSIKAQVFPGDNLNSDDILGMILELSKNDLLFAYSIDGKDYLQVTGWHHQRIDKPQKPKCPEPTEHSKIILGTLQRYPIQPNPIGEREEPNQGKTLSVVHIGGQQ
jgi:hypothetical protein